MFYPEITDEDFYEKLYLKKEFRENEILTLEPNKKGDVNKDVKKDKTDINVFELEPHQNFLKNFISPDTPYNGVLIYHGTGVGKTCTAISIAEGFKKSLRNMNKRILVLLTLKDNFINGIYNFVEEKHKKNPEDIVQCTGREYELGEEYKHLTEIQKRKEVLNKIKHYYEFKGYTSFPNYVSKMTGGWKGEEDKITDQIKKFISKEFDDRVIIIDEIQNIKTTRNELTKNIQPILQSIIKYGKNIKLILMSATPMFDKPDEIIYYMNLLLLNDGRETINKDDVFTSTGTLKPGAENILRQYFKGYVSYIRSEKPDTFPFRIYPKNSIVPHVENFMSGAKIDEDKRLKYTHVVPCNMENIQANTYLYHYLSESKKNKKLLNKLNNLNKPNLDNANLIADYDVDEADVNSVNTLNNIINNKNEENYINENLVNNSKSRLKIKNKNNNNNSSTISNKENIGGIKYLDMLTKISIIVFPVASINSNLKTDKSIVLNSKELSPIGTVGKTSINNSVDNGMGGYYKVSKDIGSKKVTRYKYQSHAIFNKDTIDEAPFADEKHLQHYSTKFYSILQQIKKAKGLVFVFSDMIDSATVPFALMLEQNGFVRECTDGEDKLLEYTPNKVQGGGKRERICYLCGEKQGYKSHIPGAKDFHSFKVAKYILYFGQTRDIIRVKKSEALRKFSSYDNKYGEEIKVFIGTKSVSEGLDFKRIRQIHIINPWYNLSRHEQIIGRGIRRESHIDLPVEERNCEIFQYVAVIDKKFDSKISERESVDLKNYRIAENKDLIIKKISRVMKESAVDCVLFRNSNIINDKRIIKQITASGEEINMPVADKPFSPMCDYQENCCFQCNWMPKPGVKYPINMDTYNIRFAKIDIENAKKYVKLLFRNNIIYSLKHIEKYVTSKIPGINNIFIYMALNIITDNKDEVVYDKFSRKGYIIYRGDYYVFQPFDLKRDELPLDYRMYPSTVKKYSFRIDVDKIQNDNSDIKMNKYEENQLNINNSSFNKILNQIQRNLDMHVKIMGDVVTSSNRIYYIYSVIGMIFSSLDTKLKKSFIKNILQQYYSNSNELINHIIEYFNDKKLLINYYKHINPDGRKKDAKYVGFVLYNDFYVLPSIEENKSNNLNFSTKKIDFIKASSDIANKIIDYMEIEASKLKNSNKNLKYNEIHGIIENEKFKIKDNRLTVEIHTKTGGISQKTIIKGRVCESYLTPELLKIYSASGGKYSFDIKEKRGYICNNIEIYMRMYNYTKKDNKLWFDDNLYGYKGK